jgi:hypothetical protein
MNTRIHLRFRYFLYRLTVGRGKLGLTIFSMAKRASSLRFYLQRSTLHHEINQREFDGDTLTRTLC